MVIIKFFNLFYLFFGDNWSTTKHTVAINQKDNNQFFLKIIYHWNIDVICKRNNKQKCQIPHTLTQTHRHREREKDVIESISFNYHDYDSWMEKKKDDDDNKDAATAALFHYNQKGTKQKFEYNQKTKKKYLE